MSFWGGTDEEGNPDYGTAGDIAITALLFSAVLYIIEKCTGQEHDVAKESKETLTCLRDGYVGVFKSIKRLFTGGNKK